MLREPNQAVWRLAKQLGLLRFMRREARHKRGGSQNRYMRVSTNGAQLAPIESPYFAHTACGIILSLNQHAVTSCEWARRLLSIRIEREANQPVSFYASRSTYPKITRELFISHCPIRAWPSDPPIMVVEIRTAAMPPPICSKNRLVGCMPREIYRPQNLKR